MPYEYKWLLENLNNLVLLVSIIFGICKEDIDDYLSYSLENNHETDIYRMFDMIEICGNDEDWIDAYRYVVKTKKINSRSKLVDKFNVKLKELDISNG